MKQNEDRDSSPAAEARAAKVMLSALHLRVPPESCDSGGSLPRGLRLTPPLVKDQSADQDQTDNQGETDDDAGQQARQQAAAPGHDPADFALTS